MLEIPLVYSLPSSQTSVGPIAPALLVLVAAGEHHGFMVPTNLVRSRLGTSKLPMGNDLRVVNDADFVSNASHAQSPRSSQCDPKPSRLTRSILHPLADPRCCEF
jgi:hypothetical protein